MQKNLCRLIIIDDNPINITICEQVIRHVNKNAQFKSFTLAQLALKYIEEEYSNPETNIPTLLFLDLHMPAMDGFEFLESFLKLDPKIQEQFKIVILSSTADKNELKRVNVYSCVTGYRAKPLTIEVLKHLVDENGCNI